MMEKGESSIERVKGKIPRANGTHCECSGPETLSGLEHCAPGLDIGEVSRTFKSLEALVRVWSLF